jgi:pyruvate/2-oxoglutarate dehydrogenase complex dihydrolipoamide dehydrogenase (E3) component
VDQILVSAGRVPDLENLGLETAGVQYDPRKGVLVDDRLRTTNRRIYAAGDICMKHKFTHAADSAARIVLRNALFFGRSSLSALTIPHCTYTDPEIAHVGLSASEAQSRGIEIDTFARNLKDVDRAITDGEEEGLVKIHLKKGTDKILGATIIARHAGEMISEITLAMVAKVGLGKISGVIHPYPTQAEAIKQVADAYYRSKLTPTMYRFIARWLAWIR